MKHTFSALIFIFCFVTTEAQIGRLALSPLQKVEQKIAKTDITIEYSRPAMRGRKIFGGLVPYDALWRTGANRNTKISFSEDVYIEDTRLKKGTYALFSKPGLNQWEIFFYTTTDNWDVPEDWDPAKIAATISVSSELMAFTASSLSITIDEITNNDFVLNIVWEKTKVGIPIKLTTAEQMDKTIAKQLNGPSSGDYYLAAQYHMEAGTNLEEALKWIDLSIKNRPEEVWWDYRIKALICQKLGRSMDVKKAGTKGLELAKKKQSEYGINEFNKILK